MDWYDAWWWRCHAAARDHLLRHRRDVVEVFDEAVEQLRPVPHLNAEVLPAGAPPSLLAGMRAALAELDQDRLEDHELATFGRHVVHDAFPDEVVDLGRDVVERIVGLALEPSYDFLSLYRGTGVCTPHLDAPNAGYTLDVCLEQSAPWPLLFRPGAPWIADTDRPVAVPGLDEPGWHQVVMEAGDAVVFSGSAVWHGRRPMPDPEGFCHLGFLHFVPVGTAALVQPQRWAEHFAVPTLAGVVAAV